MPIRLLQIVTDFRLKKESNPGPLGYKPIGLTTRAPLQSPVVEAKQHRARIEIAACLECSNITGVDSENIIVNSVDRFLSVTNCPYY